MKLGAINDSILCNFCFVKRFAMYKEKQHRPHRSKLVTLLTFWPLIIGVYRYVSNSWHSSLIFCPRHDRIRSAVKNTEDSLFKGLVKKRGGLVGNICYFRGHLGRSGLFIMI